MSTATRQLRRTAALAVKQWNRQDEFMSSSTFRRAFRTEFLEPFIGRQEALLRRRLETELLYPVTYPETRRAIDEELARLVEGHGHTTLTLMGGLIQNPETGEWQRVDEALSPSSEEIPAPGRNTPWPESSPDGTPTTSSSSDSPSEPGNRD